MDDLKIGIAASDHSRVEVNGDQYILTQDSLRIGEYTGSEGEFVLNIPTRMHSYVYPSESRQV